MAVYDDPVFVKALKLLHSPAKDSAVQIMHLLEEVMDQKYGGTKTLNLKLHNISEEPLTSLEVPKARGSRGGSPLPMGHSEKSSRSSTPPSETVSIRTTPDRDDGDLALEIFEDDLFCTVCKGIRVTSDNRLLECNDCHSLYHQECHKPPVDNDANDPRLVWSCGDCTKRNQEKTSVKAKSSSSDLSSNKKKSDGDAGHSESSSKKQKTDDSPQEPPPKKHKSENEKSESRSSHKRSDKNEKSGGHSGKSSSHSSSKQSPSSSSSGSSSRSESRNKPSGSGSTLNFNKAPGSPNGKTPSCTANIIAADRRLQNMKKKAAAKMQEKRLNPK